MMSKEERKKLVVLGAAESGIGAALLGKKQGWEVFVSDIHQIKDAYKSTLDEAGIRYEQGQHSLDKILQADTVIKSPGIPEQIPVIEELRKKGVEIISEIEFGYRYKGNSRIIAITGSNGKSTTTKLITWMLEQAHYDVAMVGNIGYSFAKRIVEKPAQWYVMEVSSFQLDDILKFRPDVAILLNITPDHLDRYGYSFEKYIASKFRITAQQTEADCFIVNMDDAAIEQYLKTYTPKAKTIFFTMNHNLEQEEGGFINDETMHIRYEGEEMNMSIHDLSLKGKHNQYNSMAAGISGRIAGIRKEKIRASFSTFEGLEHRLQYVATVKGVDFINDSKATNVNSVWFALESMEKPTILMLGGVDKGNDYAEITELVGEKVKAIVCIGDDTQPILNAFQSVVPEIIETKSMKEAVLAAYTLAEKGEVVLLSPACASFDWFKDYEDRGRQFTQAIMEL